MIKDIISKFKGMSDNEAIFVIILGAAAACLFYKSQVSGFANLNEIGDQVGLGPAASGMGGSPPAAGPRRGPEPSPRGPGPNKAIGIELKKRQPDESPSMAKQMKLLAGKPPVVQKTNVIDEAKATNVPGLMEEESMMFKPFDEVWNPGFMPLDMVFKNIDQSSKTAPLGQAAQGPVTAGAPAGRAASGGAGGDAGRAAPGGAGGGGGAVEDLKIVLVYAPWCGHSKNMLPDYEKVKSEFHNKVVNGKNVSIVMYNSDVDKDKVKEYDVKGFPSLFVERNGERESFPHRTYDKIAAYINA